MMKPVTITQARLLGSHNLLWSDPPCPLHLHDGWHRACPRGTEEVCVPGGVLRRGPNKPWWGRHGGEGHFRWRQEEVT